MGVRLSAATFLTAASLLAHAGENEDAVAKFPELSQWAQNEPELFKFARECETKYLSQPNSSKWSPEIRLRNVVKDTLGMKEEIETQKKLITVRAKREASANAGNPADQYRMGLSYGGFGTHRCGEKVQTPWADKEKAAYWLTRAAKSGYPPAQCKLGLYVGGTENLAWTKKAAEHGETEMMWATGVTYKSGSGVPVNYREAYFWLSIYAAQDGVLSKEVRTDLVELEKKMSPEQIAAAQNAAGKWKPSPLPAKIAALRPFPEVCFSGYQDILKYAE
jgi:TPR repeat protein